MFVNRRRRQSQRGAQSLEWVGLGTFVLVAMTAATTYANNNLGGTLGSVLIHHLQTALGG